MHVTQEQVDALVTKEGWWHEKNATGSYTLNCSGPWSEPEDTDPTAGEICTISVENGHLHWRWEWDHGYDEHLSFPHIEDFAEFYDRLLAVGIGSTDYADFNCVIY